MVKCAVTSCPNREQLGTDRGLSRASKRFFSLPRDPARIKVWLAALREPDSQDWTESRLICEDHFLPEDITDSGVSPDAIPLMPPCLEEELGIDVWPEDPEEDDSWGAGDQDDEEEEEGERETGGEADEEMREENEEDQSTADDTQMATEAAPPAHTEAAPPAHTEDAPQPHRTHSPDAQRLLSSKKSKAFRSDAALPGLTPQFLELMLNSDRSLDLHQASAALKTRIRRLNDITAVLKGLDLVQKESPSKVRWTGKCPISSFLWQTQKMQKESEKMKLVEETLDGLIKSCAQQLFTMTDDQTNARLAYVTLSDIQNLPAFQNQAVIVVKAPEETRLEVPAPKKDSIEIHLKSSSGPISVLTCEIWPVSRAEQVFQQIQYSRIKTSPLQTESSASQSAVPGL